MQGDGEVPSKPLPDLVVRASLWTSAQWCHEVQVSTEAGQQLSWWCWGALPALDHAAESPCVPPAAEAPATLSLHRLRDADAAGRREYGGCPLLCGIRTRSAF